MNNIIEQSELTLVESDGVHFYTVTATGDSGISFTGLSVLCGVSQQAISKLIKSLTTKAASKSLEPLVGKDFILTTTKSGMKLLTAEVCIAIIEHYAFKGKETAQFTYRKFAAMGFNSWVHSITGWQNLRQLQSTSPTSPPVTMPTPEEIEYLKSRPWEKAELEGESVDWEDVASKSGYSRAMELIKNLSKPKRLNL